MSQTQSITRGSQTISRTHQKSPLMSRVIQQLRLDLVLAAAKLPAHRSVAEGDRQGLVKTS